MSGVGGITFAEVGAKGGCEADGGAVPPHIGEGFLADALGLLGRLDDAGHELQVPPAELELVGHQPLQQLAVLRLVPAHPAAVEGQAPGGREGRAGEEDGSASEQSGAAPQPAPRPAPRGRCSQPVHGAAQPQLRRQQQQRPGRPRPRPRPRRGTHGWAGLQAMPPRARSALLKRRARPPGAGNNGSGQGAARARGWRGVKQRGLGSELDPKPQPQRWPMFLGPGALAAGGTLTPGWEAGPTVG